MQGIVKGGKKTRQTEEEVGRQHQGMGRPGVWQVPEGSGEEGKMEQTGCKIICGAPTTLAVKGLMMMMMMMMKYAFRSKGNNSEYCLLVTRSGIIILLNLTLLDLNDTSVLTPVNHARPPEEDGWKQSIKSLYFVLCIFNGSI